LNPKLTFEQTRRVFMVDLADLQQAVEAGDRNKAVELTQAAVDDGMNPKDVLDVMTSAMDVVGAKFQQGEMFVPEMLIAARAMKEALVILEPELVAAGVKPEFTAIVGTVEGDLHDIGKNLVGMMWKGAGFEVVDLGVNVTSDRFVSAAQEHSADIIGLSALLTTTMPNMRAVIDAVRGAGLAARVVIGGAPTTPEFAQQIGADGHASDAGAAVDLARGLLV
jgi:5-methyltetrahydrofolate--homocysteine methyltransferase